MSVLILRQLKAKYTGKAWGTGNQLRSPGARPHASSLKDSSGDHSLILVHHHGDSDFCSPLLFTVPDFLLFSNHPAFAWCLVLWPASSRSPSFLMALSVGSIEAFQVGLSLLALTSSRGLTAVGGALVPGCVRISTLCMGSPRQGRHLRLPRSGQRHS